MRDEARRIAANIAKLPELLRKNKKHPPAALLRDVKSCSEIILVPLFVFVLIALPDCHCAVVGRVARRLAQAHTKNLRGLTVDSTQPSVLGATRGRDRFADRRPDGMVTIRAGISVDGFHDLSG